MQKEILSIDPSAGTTTINNPVVVDESLRGVNPEIIIPSTGQNGIDITNKLEGQRVKLELDPDKIGLYLIKLSGHILNNIDEIWEANPKMHTEPKDNGSFSKNKKNELKWDCIYISQAGGVLAQHGNDLDDLKGMPQVLEGRIEDGSFILERFDWVELENWLVRVTHDDGFDYFREKNPSLHSLKNLIDTTFEGYSFGDNPTGFLNRYGKIEVRRDLLPPEVSLLVSPV